MPKHGVNVGELLADPQMATQLNRLAEETARPEALVKYLVSEAVRLRSSMPHEASRLIASCYQAFPVPVVDQELTLINWWNVSRPMTVAI